MMIKSYSIFGVLIASLSLTGCESHTDEVAKKIAEINNNPSAHIETTPVFLPVAPYTYSAQSLRSPFMPPSLERDINHMAGRTVMPDFNRPRQDLENYSLEQLTMKGTLQGNGSPMYALIDVPDKGISKIQVGNYIGTNNGRVVSITPTAINVIEIVPNGNDGYVERPRSLILVSSGK